MSVVHGGDPVPGCASVDQGVCLDASDGRASDRFAFAFDVPRPPAELDGIDIVLAPSVKGTARTTGDAATMLDVAKGVGTATAIVFTTCVEASGCWDAPAPSAPAP